MTIIFKKPGESTSREILEAKIAEAQRKFNEAGHVPSLSRSMRMYQNQLNNLKTELAAFDKAAETTKP